MVMDLPRLQVEAIVLRSLGASDLEVPTFNWALQGWRDLVESAQTINPLVWAGGGLGLLLVLFFLGFRQRALRQLLAAWAQRISGKKHKPGPVYYDPVTGLPGERLFRILLKQALARVARTERLVALLIFELDQIRVLNDEHGYASGDVALRVLAARVKSCLRSTDTVARLQGNQFVVILETIASAEDTATIAQKILHTVVLPLSLGRHEIMINTSMGIGLYPADGSDTARLFESACSAMRAARDEGLPIQFHSAHLNEQVFEQPIIEEIPAAPQKP